MAVKLSTDQFTKALSSYGESALGNDTLARSQIDKLQVVWRDADEANPKFEDFTSDHDGSSDTAEANHDGTSSTLVDGVLSLSSKYISIRIHARVKADEIKNGMHFVLNVRAILAEGKKEKGKGARLWSGMIERLKADRIVSRLLFDGGESKSKSSPPLTLCEALIHQSEEGSGELEERVNVEDGVLEGIRTAILSHLESNLDVLELLLGLPYLPRHCTNNDIAKLASRAYLRLLEDGMFDACEREGEDDILDDLQISQPKRTKHDED